MSGALSPAPAAATDSDLKHAYAFRLDGSNGYSVVALAANERADGRGEIVLFVDRQNAGAIYTAPAMLTATSVEADLGALGRVSLEVTHPSRRKTVRQGCGDEAKPISLAPIRYRGTFEFHGEEGFTEATSAAPTEYTRLFLDLLCAGIAGWETSGAGLPGARLRLRSRGNLNRFELQANKNRPRARSKFEVEVHEERGQVQISRSTSLWAGAEAFQYDPLLRTAVLDPPHLRGRAVGRRRLCAPMGNKGASPDAAIAVVAARQHGAVTHRQLIAAGLGRSAITKRVRTGRLHRLHRGVYAVGHVADNAERRWMAAVLACGPGAVLSHMSAAALWQLLRPGPGPVDVSVPTQGGRKKQDGIRLHRCRSLRDEHLSRRQDIPVTTPARTIADLEGTAPNQWVRRAVRQAEIKGYRLDTEIDTERTRSDLESDFLSLCRRHGLPVPEVNMRVGRWTVDFLWREQKIAVETDFYGFHRGRVAFQDDHARDLDLRRHGFAVHRFSEEQVNDRPAEVIADLREALGPAS